VLITIITRNIGRVDKMRILFHQVKVWFQNRRTKVRKSAVDTMKKGEEKGEDFHPPHTFSSFGQGPADVWKSIPEPSLRGTKENPTMSTPAGPFTISSSGSIMSPVPVPILQNLNTPHPFYPFPFLSYYSN